MPEGTEVLVTPLLDGSEVRLKPNESSLLKLLEIQWHDHFQTRTQTWKTLEISALLAVALVGIDWRLGNPLVTIVAASLLLLVAQFGIQITLKHRRVEEIKFKIIASLEQELGLHGLLHEAAPKIKKPEPLSWWSIFRVKHSNTPLFILRIHFVIQLFAAGYLVLRLINLSR